MIRSTLLASALIAVASMASATVFGSKTVGVFVDTTVVANGNAAFVGGAGITGVTTNVNTNTGFNGTAGASSINGDLGAGLFANSSAKTAGVASLSGQTNTASGVVKQATLFGRPVGSTFKDTTATGQQNTDVAGGYAAQAGGATLFGASKTVTSGSTEINMNNGSFGGVSQAHASNVTVGLGAAVSTAHTSATVGGQTTLFTSGN